MNAEPQVGSPLLPPFHRWLRNLPIRIKFMLVSLAVIVTVLAMAAAILLAHEWVQGRAALVRHAETLAAVVGNNSTAALTFHDPDVARDILSALRYEPGVLFASIHGADQRPFATFARDGFVAPPAPTRPIEGPPRFQGRTLSLTYTVTLDGDTIGHLFLLLSTSSLHDVFVRYLFTLLIVLVTAVAAGLFLTWHLQMLVAAPLLRLADTALRVAREQDYTVRVQREGHDEIGRLVDAFNTMLDRIGAREQTLRENARLLEEYQGRLRTLASELVIAEERERRALATELHDSVCQTLAMTKLRLSELQSQFPEGRAGEELNQACKLLSEATLEARTLIAQLSPKLLYDIGLEAAIENLGEQFQSRFGIQVALHDDGKPKPVVDDLRALLFRGVQELLMNAVKHGQATRADVFLRRIGDRIELTVMDNGKGFVTPPNGLPSSSAGGFGLFSIHERIRHAGGVLTIDSTPGEGTEVMLSVPFNAGREGPNV
jgi:signal transduction histidine kinase